MTEDRLRPKNPTILLQPTVPTAKQQSEYVPKRRSVRKARKNACKIGKERMAKKPDYSDFETKTKLFRFIDISRVRNPLGLLDFIHWNVVPSSVRGTVGFPVSQKDFAEKYSISPDTLTDWKRLPFFWDEVAIHRNQEFRRYTSDVYYGITKRAIETGDPRAAELFAKLFEGYSEKVRIEDETPPKEMSPEEIEKVRHALYNIGLKNIIKANAPDDKDTYTDAITD